NGVADPETIDLTWQLATSAPAGPFKILDIVGLETAYNINQMKPASQQEGTTEYKIGKLLKEKIDKGDTGVKGFYDYTKKSTKEKTDEREHLSCFFIISREITS
ncbi:MAG: hypothetical protein IKE12_00935, partial [Erysipelotrichaceae bacterium]|nr:hypothetical protein [Erysipelotrichaceae bacterium]